MVEVLDMFGRMAFVVSLFGSPQTIQEALANLDGPNTRSLSFDASMSGTVLARLRMYRQRSQAFVVNEAQFLLVRVTTKT